MQLSPYNSKHTASEAGEGTANMLMTSSRQSLSGDAKESQFIHAILTSQYLVNNKSRLLNSLNGSLFNPVHGHTTGTTFDCSGQNEILEAFSLEHCCKVK